MFAKRISRKDGQVLMNLGLQKMNAREKLIFYNNLKIFFSNSFRL